MFNMKACSRVKKKSRSQDLSELWENDDDESRLILRLIDSAGYPWVVGHYGTQEILRSPLVVPILNVDGCRVSVFLRDFANRGQENCIKRQFNIEFSSAAEAASFQFAHDKFFCEYKKKKKNEKKKKEDKKEKEEEKQTKENDRLKRDHQERILPEPPSKKRRVSCISSSSSGDNKQGDGLEQEDKKKDEYIKEFNQGDDLDLLDNNFLETQDPFHDFDE
jgi:ribosomal protein L12E/L44/L45/RPP1/RPP2